MSLVMPNGNPTPQQQGQYQAAQNQIGAGYQQYLGRPMNQDDFNSQTSGGQHYQQQNVNHALSQIQNSDEARAYAQRQSQPQQNEPAPAAGAPAPTQQYAPQSSGGGGQAVPGVPQTMAKPSFSGQAAFDNAPKIQSGYSAQQIRDFTGRQLDIPDYQKTTFDQFSDPRNMPIQGQMDQNLLGLLQNPHSVGQTWQDQMFESQKDDALQFAKQAGLAGDQNLVSRGIGLGGGQQVANQQAVNSDLFSKLLAGRRDVATKAAQINRADELNALQAGEQGMSGNTSRMSEIFRNILSGQSAQAGENQFDAKYGFDTETAKAGNERDNYASYLGGRQLQGTENAREEQFKQSAFGLTAQSQQAARQAALQEMMANNNADLGWANYGLNADGQFLNFLNGQG